MSQVPKPSFKFISPWVYFSSWCFAVLNMAFLAPTFVIANGSQGLVLVGLVPSLIWGIVFFLLGIIMVYGLTSNRWGIIKATLGVGFLIKSAFAWALIFTFFANPSSLGIIGLWFAVMVWQGLCITYFTPVVREHNA